MGLLRGNFATPPDSKDFLSKLSLEAVMSGAIIATDKNVNCVGVGGKQVWVG
jgi:hypothetical protein